MSTNATDTIAILKLYELRREAELRRARSWFVRQFAPTGARRRREEKRSRMEFRNAIRQPDRCAATVLRRLREY